MPAIVFAIKRSIVYLFFQLMLFTLTFIMIFFLPISFKIKCLIACLTLVYELNILLNANAKVTKIVYFKNKKWGIEVKKEQVDATLLGSSLITPYLAVLHFKVLTSSKKISCVVLRDSLPKGQYRELLVACATL